MVCQVQFKTEETSVGYQLKKLVWQAGKKLVPGLKLEEVLLEHPENLEHGDYATNLAMTILARIHSRSGKLPTLRGDDESKKPMVLAKKIASGLKADYLEKVEVVKPGFINFWLSEKWLVNQAGEVIKQKEKFGSSSVLKGKKFLLEHTSPDPIKTLHIGHLRNNFLGMTMARVLEFLGAKVVKDCINNDRGMHVCRAMFGYLVFAKKDIGIQKDDLLKFKVSGEMVRKRAARVDWKKLLNEWGKNKQEWLMPKDLGLKPDHFDLVVYAVGARAEDEIDSVSKQVREMLKAWEAENKLIRDLWRMIIDWSLKGYQKTYARIGSVHDWVWHESQLYKKGKKLIYDGLKKGIFKKSEGAIVTDLSKYGLPDTVVIKSDGTALYHTFDINLTLQKRKKFPSDLYIWDIGNDQILYLKQLYAICEQLGIGKVSDYFHLNYGYITLKGKGKMSSRAGTIVKADDLLDLMHQEAKKIIEDSAPELRKIKAEEKEMVAEAVGLGALKYALLKYSREKDVQFDIKESISLEGNSGPYLQYTYARAQSVLGKAKFRFTPPRCSRFTPRYNFEELVILRTIYKFPEVVLEAGEKYAPNLICNFLFDLAQKFNLFYNRHRIIGSDQEGFRLALTAAIAQVLQNGLNLLGIKSLERM